MVLSSRLLMWLYRTQPRVDTSRISCLLVCYLSKNVCLKLIESNSTEIFRHEFMLIKFKSFC